MKSHELFRSLLQDCNAKELASSMKLSTSTIYKWTEPATDGGSGAPNPLDRLEQMIAITRDKRLAQWLCERADGFYVKNPDVADHKKSRSVIVATNKIVQEFADMLSLIATAAIDNAVTEREARDIRARWQDLKSASEEFVNCCERGNFKAIHAHAEKTSKAGKV
jgi:hypothetical protein